MAKKKKAKSAPKKAAKKGSKKAARPAASGVKKKTARKKSTARKSTSQKKFEELAGRFMGPTKKAAVKKTASPRLADVHVLGDDAEADDAEAIVMAEMPGVKIVRLPKRPSADAGQVATVHGASLKDLKRKYIGHNSPRDSAYEAETPVVRSKVVFVQQENETSDQSMGPKAVIVRDGKVRGFQG